MSRMRSTVLKNIRHRTKLIRFINCLGYLYHKNPVQLARVEGSSNVNYPDKALVYGSSSQLNGIMANLSYFLDVSIRSLQKVHRGYSTPLRRILKSYNFLVHDRESLKRYLNAIIIAYGIKPKRASLNINVNPLSLINRKRISVQTISILSHNLMTPFNDIRDAFKRANISIYDPVKKLPNIAKRMTGETGTANFIKGLLYFYDESSKQTYNQTGYKYKNIVSEIKNGSSASKLRLFTKLSMMFKAVPYKRFIQILHGSSEPQCRLERRAKHTIRTRSDLYKFVSLCTRLCGVSMKKLTKTMSRSSNYLRSMIVGGAWSKIRIIFVEISEMLGIPERFMLSVVSYAEAKSICYIPIKNLDFKVNYQQSPIKYSKDEITTVHIKDQVNYYYSLLNAKLGELQRDPTKRDQCMATNDVIKIITEWGKLFGFSKNDFIKSNFQNLDDSLHKTRLLIKGQYYTIVDLSSWIIILRKLYRQLSTTRKMFSLPALQDTKLSPYINVRGVNLSHPILNDKSCFLGKLMDHHEHPFTGQVSHTDIKTIKSSDSKHMEFYRPVIVINKIHYHHRVVANEVPFNYVKNFVKLGSLKAGDLISFSAMVKEQYMGKDTLNSVKTIHYTLNRPIKIKIIRRKHSRNLEPVPADTPALVGYVIMNNKSRGYDFTTWGHNYGYVRYCLNKFKDWKKIHH